MGVAASLFVLSMLITHFEEVFNWDGIDCLSSLGGSNSLTLRKNASLFHKSHG